jgi:hypothetical protein
MAQIEFYEQILRKSHKKSKVKSIFDNSKKNIPSLKKIMGDDYIDS